MDVHTARIDLFLVHFRHYELVIPVGSHTDAQTRTFTFTQISVLIQAFDSFHWYYISVRRCSATFLVSRTKGLEDYLDDHKQGVFVTL